MGPSKPRNLSSLVKISKDGKGTRVLVPAKTPKARIRITPHGPGHSSSFQPHSRARVASSDTSSNTTAPQAPFDDSTLSYEDNFPDDSYDPDMECTFISFHLLRSLSSLYDTTRDSYFLHDRRVASQRRSDQRS